jgi:tripartite-type tricarboxylate transporter receptor subunit TctC
MPVMRRFLPILLALLGAASAAPCFFPSAAQAQPYPNRPVRLVVPFPPGGINDVLARVTAQKLSESLGQNVVIENRPGAGGTIGSNAVAKAAPDGYSLLFGATSTVAVSPNLYANLPYEPVRDFAAIVQIASVGSILVVNPAVPATSVGALVALARERPGALNFGSAGSGTSQHMGGELLKSIAGVDIVHVPYKGGAPAMTDLLAGQISFMIEPIPTALPHIRSGKVRALAVSTPRRAAAVPELPTIAESGYPGYDLTIWFGLLAPAGTPREVIVRVNGEMVKILASVDMRERLAAQGAEPVGDAPEAFAAHIRREIARWGDVVKASGAKVD